MRKKQPDNWRQWLHLHTSDIKYLLLSDYIALWPDVTKWEINFIKCEHLHQISVQIHQPLSGKLLFCVMKFTRHFHVLPAYFWWLLVNSYPGLQWVKDKDILLSFHNMLYIKRKEMRYPHPHIGIGPILAHNAGLEIGRENKIDLIHALCAASKTTLQVTPVSCRPPMHSTPRDNNSRSQSHVSCREAVPLSGGFLLMDGWMSPNS